MLCLNGFIDNIEQFLRGSWQFFLLAVGLMYLVLLMVAARRIGQQAAITQLRKWLVFPSAILNFFDAATVEAAVLSLRESIVHAVDADGTAVLVGRTGHSMKSRGEGYHTLAAEGTFRSASDRKLEQVLSVEWESIVSSCVDVDPVGIVQVQPSFGLLQCCPELEGGSILGVIVQLDFHVDPEQHSTALLLFDLGKKQLGLMAEEGLSAALMVFPRMLEKMTLRFAHAGEVEKELERSLHTGRVLRQMLSGYEHDVSHALANLEQCIVEAREALDGRSLLRDGDRAADVWKELDNAFRLITLVAAGGTLVVDIPEGHSPLVDMRSWDPQRLYEDILEPLLHLRRRARKDLVVDFEIEQGLPQIIVDRAAFFRAASNVIHNAFKFTEEGGVKLLIHREGTGVVFSVSDTGIGIPAEEISHLGILRHRAVNASEFPGSGMGLWMTKMLAEAMGGSIHVQSMMGVGTTVALKFPAAVHPSNFEEWSDGRSRIMKKEQGLLE